MGQKLQQDSSESKLKNEPIDEESVNVTTPDLLQAQNLALKTHNKMPGIPPLSIDSFVYLIKLGFTHKNGQKTLEGFLGGLWKTRLKILTREGYFLSHQFVNQQDAAAWESASMTKKKKKK